MTSCNVFFPSMWKTLFHIIRRITAPWFVGVTSNVLSIYHCCFKIVDDHVFVHKKTQKSMKTIKVIIETDKSYDTNVTEIEWMWMILPMRFIAVTHFYLNIERHFDLLIYCIVNNLPYKLTSLSVTYWCIITTSIMVRNTYMLCIV